MRLLRLGQLQVVSVERFIDDGGVRPLGEGIHQGRRNIPGTGEKIDDERHEEYD